MLDVLVDSPLPFHPELVEQETTFPRPSGSADQMHSCQSWKEPPLGAAASLQSYSQASRARQTQVLVVAGLQGPRSHHQVRSRLGCGGDRKGTSDAAVLLPRAFNFL